MSLSLAKAFALFRTKPQVDAQISAALGAYSPFVVVANYSALPDPTTVSGKFYWCQSSQGTQWLPGSLGGTYYPAGAYYSTGVAWSYIETPYQATQVEVDLGTVTNKFVTPFTFNNSKQISGLVPYNGAGYDVDIGVHALSAGSVSTTGAIGSTGSTVSSSAGGVYSFKFSPGVAVVSAQNFDVTDTSNAIIEAYSGVEGDGGDAMVSLNTAAKSLTVGLDRSDGDKLKFGWNYRTVGGANTFLIFDSAVSAATSPSSASVSLVDGLGVGKNIYFGGNHTTTIAAGGALMQMASCAVTLPITATSVNSAYLNSTTFSAPSALTVSTPATLAINGAPIAGSNVTFAGTPRAFSVFSGQVYFGGTTVATSSASGDFVTSGGVGIGKNVWCGGSFTTTQNNGGMVFNLAAGGVTLPLTAASVHTAYINPSIFSAPSALNVTTPSTLTIGAAPTAGTNVTFIGTPRALQVVSGLSYFGGDVNLAALTASTALRLDSNKNIVGVNGGIELISSQNLGVNATSISVTIPAGFKALKIIGTAKSTRAATLGALMLRFNNDSTLGNYSDQTMRAANSTVLGGPNTSNSGIIFADIPCASTAAAVIGNFDMIINNYTSTTQHKGLLCNFTSVQNVAADCLTGQWAGVWRSTAAVTSVQILELYGAQLAAGSVINVYGIY